MIIQVGTAMGQEEDKKDFGKLDFLLTTIPLKLADREGDSMVNLKLDILSEEITNLDKVYIKVATVKPREVYFIRAINKDVLTSEKDVKATPVPTRIPPARYKDPEDSTQVIPKVPSA